MIIAILILIHLLVLSDIITGLKRVNPHGNIALSGALLVLLTWNISIAWAIVNICVVTLFIIIITVYQINK